MTTHHQLGRTPTSRRDLTRFARQVRKKRTSAAFSQSMLANQVGISTKQLSNIECANNWPAMPVALKLCRLLGIELPKAVDSQQ
jgi:DNA-binding XRE family transcriptional regulator